MSRFVKVKHINRFTSSQGNDLWLNIEQVISAEERTGCVQCVGQETNVYFITEDSMPTLIKALKGENE